MFNRISIISPGFARTSYQQIVQYFYNELNAVIDLSTTQVYYNPESNLELLAQLRQAVTSADRQETMSQHIIVLFLRGNVLSSYALDELRRASQRPSTTIIAIYQDLSQQDKAALFVIIDKNFTTSLNFGHPSVPEQKKLSDLAGYIAKQTGSNKTTNFQPMPQFSAEPPTQSPQQQWQQDHNAFGGYVIPGREDTLIDDNDTNVDAVDTHKTRVDDPTPRVHTPKLQQRFDKNEPEDLAYTGYDAHNLGNATVMNPNIKPGQTELPPPQNQHPSAEFAPPIRQEFDSDWNAATANEPVLESVPTDPNLHSLASVTKSVVYKSLPPRDQSHPVKEDDHQVVLGSDKTADRWLIFGASIRGRGHRHSALHRDDAFAIRHERGWHIVAVADGAGSAHMSRVTANEAVKVAVDTAAQYAKPYHSVQQIQEAMEDALYDAVVTVSRTQARTTRDLGLKKEDTYFTLLMLIHQPQSDGSSVFATLQIGDGLIGAASADKFNIVAQGLHGGDASSTYFVASFKENEFKDFIDSHWIEKPLEIFVVMTDGIENDLKPSSEAYDPKVNQLQENAGKFVRAMQYQYLTWPCWKHYGEILRHIIDYDRESSNDDRTMVVVMRNDHDNDQCE